MNMKRFIYSVCLTLMLTCMVGTVGAQAAWKNTSAGKIYTTKASPGYYTGWHTIKKAKYYFNTKTGVMATGWKTIGKKTYYFGSDGKMRQYWQTINNAVYYFGKNGARRSGFYKLTVNKKKCTFYFDANGQRKTGVITVDGKNYFMNESGVMQYGYITSGSKKYYADPTTGVLAKKQLINGVYYFKADCTMAVSEWANGRWYGADGKFSGAVNLVGMIEENGSTFYYSANHTKMTGFITIGGTTYYFGPSLKTGWISVGNYKYYANSDGIIQKNCWEGKKYLLSNGTMAIGWQTIGNNRYYFDASGTRVTGNKTIDQKSYVFDSSGVLLKNQWYTKNSKKYYLGSDGAKAKGLTLIGTKYYYFNDKTGALKYKWITGSNGLRYYAHKTKGYIFRNKWFKKNGKRYYAKESGALAVGVNVINSKKYGFSAKGVLLIKKFLTVNGQTYYFGADGVAVAGTWKKISGKYYYFNAQGVMAKDTVVDGYTINADGTRGELAAGGWKTSNGKKYYVIAGKAVTGWQTINGSKYYFDSKGIMQTGVVTVGSKKYYLYPTGILATSTTIAIGSKQYTINTNGVITAEKTINISGSGTGSKIAKFAVKYVGNPYVYGGTSLTNGADCSGFVQTVFANFNISLLRVANDQMYGPSSSQIKSGYKAAVTVDVKNMLPGDLVFYGSNGYASHVAIYIGNGNIVHASNSQPYPQGGIKISNYDYATPIKIVRYWS